MDDFTLACIEAALWSSNDELDDTGGSPLDENFGIEDIAEDSLAKLASDCTRFQASPAWLAVIEVKIPARIAEPAMATRLRHQPDIISG